MYFPRKMSIEHQQWYSDMFRDLRNAEIDLYEADPGNEDLYVKLDMLVQITKFTLMLGPTK